MLKASPEQMGILKQNNPRLADAVTSGSLEEFASILKEQQKARIDREKQRIRLLKADPFDAEAQKLIAKEIEDKNIEQNMKLAMEYSPESFGTVVMLYIDCKVNGHNVKAFVDSGAQTTIMSQAAAERCNLMRLLDRRWEGIAKGVGVQKILGRIHMVQIQIRDDFLTSSFAILEHQQMDILLGLDMLKSHQCSIDLKRNVLIIGSTGTETPFLTESELPDFARLSANQTEEASGNMIGSEEKDIEEALKRSVQEVDNKRQKCEATGIRIDDKFNEVDVQTLIAYGFSREKSVEALRKSNGDVTQATAALFASSLKFYSNSILVLENLSNIAIMDDDSIIKSSQKSFSLKRRILKEKQDNVPNNDSLLKDLFPRDEEQEVDSAFIDSIIKSHQKSFHSDDGKQDDSLFILSQKESSSTNKGNSYSNRIKNLPHASQENINISDLGVDDSIADTPSRNKKTIITRRAIPNLNILTESQKITTPKSVTTSIKDFEDNLSFHPNVESTRLLNLTTPRRVSTSQLRPPLNLSSKSLYNIKLRTQQVIEDGTQMSFHKEKEEDPNLSVQTIYNQKLMNNQVREGGMQTSPLPRDDLIILPQMAEIQCDREDDVVELPEMMEDSHYSDSSPRSGFYPLFMSNTSTAEKVIVPISEEVKVIPRN
ncbi:DDI1 [Lepeophtheirus salmonis]|uniref:DDI1 n=1 Tax=Lepeophtheirus salmonis TaxID=72036 RepID=A0A7R8CIT8_LEPSM|nr:DDI1 [Lepeophtheirus salmonis]CAF2831839.1 DDI1 [Lepeophtheirus salmonis]